MANTADTSKAGRIIQVTYTGTGADWNYKTNGGFASALWVDSIIWLPSAANDILIINEGGIDGPSIVHWKASAVTDTKQISFSKPVRIKPYIDLSDQTYGTIANTKIIFILA
jgi:hypothetical protein